MKNFCGPQYSKYNNSRIVYFYMPLFLDYHSFVWNFSKNHDIFDDTDRSR